MQDSVDQNVFVLRSLYSLNWSILTIEQQTVKQQKQAPLTTSIVVLMTAVTLLLLQLLLLCQLETPCYMVSE
jgi:hypothetical protein